MSEPPRAVHRAKRGKGPLRRGFAKVGTEMKQQRRRGGCPQPPNENVIGRTAVARILKCSRTTIGDLEEKQLLMPTIVDADGSRWYALDGIMKFAVVWKRIRRRFAATTAKAAKAKRKAKAAPPVDQEPLYDPAEPLYDPDPVRRAPARTVAPGGRASPPAPFPSASTPSAAPPAAPPVFPMKKGDPVPASWFADDIPLAE
jgi:hypothetical protein